MVNNWTLQISEMAYDFVEMPYYHPVHGYQPFRHLPPPSSRDPNPTDQEEVAILFKRGRWFGEELKRVSEQYATLCSYNSPAVWKKVLEFHAENYKAGGGFQHEHTMYLSRAFASTLRWISQHPEECKEPTQGPHGPLKTPQEVVPKAKTKLE